MLFTIKPCCRHWSSLTVTQIHFVSCQSCSGNGTFRKPIQGFSLSNMGGEEEANTYDFLTLGLKRISTRKGTGTSSLCSIMSFLQSDAFKVSFFTFLFLAFKRFLKYKPDFAFRFPQVKPMETPFPPVISSGLLPNSRTLEAKHSSQLQGFTTWPRRMGAAVNLNHTGGMFHSPKERVRKYGVLCGDRRAAGITRAAHSRAN